MADASAKPTLTVPIATVPNAGRIALVLWTVLAGFWLAAVAGHPPPVWLARTVAIAAAVTTAVRATGLVRFLGPGHRPQGPLLAGVLVLGIVLGTAGLAHEVGFNYYTDEGHYLHKAQTVNEGKLLFQSFVYPHLTYYLDAFALYLADLFPAPTAWVADALFGVSDPETLPWMVLRWVTAGLGVLTLVPVFLLARRLGGSLAAVLAAGLTAFAVDYQDGFQVNICDVPSAFFATVAVFFVGRLAERETRRDYLWAGVASGLAAAAKYPAGVVAVAIVGVWVVHRVRRRDFSWGLVQAGLVSLGVFLATNPSLLAYPAEAFTSPRGLFFGVRQYAQHGWVGVTPPSNTLFYLGTLAGNFRWPALVLAAAGLFVLAPEVRRRLAELLPFPVAYLALLGAMSMVVVRNLFPVMPTVAVLLGVASAGLVARVRRAPRAAAVVVAVAVLAWPAAAAVLQTASLARESTRERMSAWMREHLPRGAGVLKEEYTPNFPWDFATLERRFAFRIPDERFADPRYDFLLLASHAYGRFFNPDNEALDRAAWYEDVFERYELVHRETPGILRRGPELRLYRLDPRVSELRDRRTWSAEDAFVVHPSMKGEDEVRFTRAGRVAVFHEALAAGRYLVRLKGDLRGDGRIEARGLDNALLASAEVRDGGATLELAAGGKVLLAVELPPGSVLERLGIAAP